MSGQTSVLSEALERVDLFRVASALGILDLRHGVQKSPFRTDKHGKSFSVFEGGTRFRDHAREEHAGGTWHFVTLARPEFSKQQVAEFIIRLAGLDPEANRKPGKAAYRQFSESMRRAMYEDRKRALQETQSFDELQPWPRAADRFWSEGREHLSQAGQHKRRLAESRGWPIAVVDYLLELDLISAPWLPWSTPRKPKAQRGIAFKVEMPIYTTGKQTEPEMRTVG